MSAPGYLRDAKELSRSDWETPLLLFQAIQEKLHAKFSLDAAASAENAKCERYLTEQDNALVCSWGESKGRWWDEAVFINPPYGRGLDKWIDKCIEEAKKNIVVALLPDGTDTEWFWKAYNNSTEIYLLKGRVPFVGSTSGNPSGSVVVVFAPHPSRGIIRMWDWKETVRQMVAGEVNVLYS